MTGQEMQDMKGARAASIVKMMKDALGGNDMTLEGNRLVATRLESASNTFIGSVREAGAATSRDREGYLDNRFTILSPCFDREHDKTDEALKKQHEDSRTERADKKQSARAEARIPVRRLVSGRPREIPAGAQFKGPDGKLRARPASAVAPACRLNRSPFQWVRNERRSQAAG